MVEKIKSSVIAQTEPIISYSRAFMHELRNHNETKKIYDVDPYVEVYQFRENFYGFYSDSLDGMGAPWMYLIVGPEKAMLVDTSFGCGNLKGLVEELTGGKETILVNTHASPDHSCGNFAFERAYCHTYTAPYLEMQFKGEFSAHLRDRLFGPDGKPCWTEFDPADLVPVKEYEICPVEDGYTWDLGSGYEVELVWLPGHQPGHAGFLDKHNRILIGGDDFVCMRIAMSSKRPGPYREYGTVEALRNQLRRLVKRTDEFDSIFPGHFCVDLDNSVVQSLLDTCEQVCSHPEEYDRSVKGPFDRRKMYYKLVDGMGVIAYSAEGIFIDDRVIPGLE